MLGPDVDKILLQTYLKTLVGPSNALHSEIAFSLARICA